MFRMVPSNGVPVGIGMILRLLPGLFASHRRVREFEGAFSRSFGRHSAFATWSGRCALTLGLMAFKKLRPGKSDVLIPALTCESVYYAVKRAGLTPVLYDIDPDTLGTSAEALGGKITARTLCVVAVSMYGIAVDMAAVREKTEAAGCFLLEDISQSLGAEWDGKKLGTFGNVAVFSFGKSKNISTVQGGMLLARGGPVGDTVSEIIAGWQVPALVDRFLLFGTLLVYAVATRPFIFGLLAWLGIPVAGKKPTAGFPLRKMGPLQSALGLLMLRRLEILTSSRRRNGLEIRRCLAGSRAVAVPVGLDSRSGTSVFLRFPVIVRSTGQKARLMNECNRHGIWARASAYKPIYELSGDPPEGFPATRDLADYTILVPTHPSLTRKDIDTLCRILR